MDSTTCRICGRKLTNPVSMEREIGPVCEARLLKENRTEEIEVTHVTSCHGCKWIKIMGYESPCKGCKDFSNWEAEKAG